MINDGLSAPLHPGAEKYYKEAGLDVGRRPTVEGAGQGCPAPSFLRVATVSTVRIAPLWFMLVA